MDKDALEQRDSSSDMTSDLDIGSSEHQTSPQDEEHGDSQVPLLMYAPITRIDKDAWLIEGQATSDAVDSYGTIFDYESSKKAFATWRGNIREMHQNKAVGRAIEVVPDDEERRIILRARISKGARDTWEKILDGTLSGFSISVPPGRFKTKSVVRNGKSVPMYYDHELAEVSVVDHPGSPNCDIAIVRADGLATEALAIVEEEMPPPTPEQQLLERAGARVSTDTQGKMHQSITHTLKAAVSQMANCGCDSCMKAQKLLDPDGDGDIDIGSFDDPDGDADSLTNGRDGDMERAIISMVERALSPVYTRLSSIAGTLARSNATLNTPNVESIVSGAITRAVEAATATHASNLATVRAELSAVKETVGKIADTPMPGAPVLNTSALPRPTEKSLPTDPYQAPPRSGSSVYDAIANLSARGQLDTQDKQVAALHYGLMAQQQRRP